MKLCTVGAARPYAYPFDPAHTAVVLIDMQRDFLEPGGSMFELLMVCPVI